MSTDFADFNKTIIAEFHANGGKVGGPFADATVVLLTTIGAKSGQPRIAPLVSMDDGDRTIVFASKGGAPTHPDWYHNILANPLVTVEKGTERFQARAVIAEEEERKRLYTKIAELRPNFAEYQQKTTRPIPVVILERIN